MVLLAISHKTIALAQNKPNVLILSYDDSRELRNLTGKKAYQGKENEMMKNGVLLHARTL